MSKDNIVGRVFLFGYTSYISYWIVVGLLDFAGTNLWVCMIGMSYADFWLKPLAVSPLGISPDGRLDFILFSILSLITGSLFWFYLPRKVYRIFSSLFKLKDSSNMT